MLHHRWWLFEEDKPLPDITFVTFLRRRKLTAISKFPLSVSLFISMQCPIFSLPNPKAQFSKLATVFLAALSAA
jgi:hypothetical protein